MKPVCIKELTRVNHADLRRCWCRAFSDYDVPLQVSDEELHIRLTQASYSPELSCGAFVAGRLVGFWLTGLRCIDGALVGYDAGTAIIPEHRGKGVSKQLSDYLDLLLLRKKVSKYILEVFCNNAKALRLYQKKGFSVLETVQTFRATPFPDHSLANHSYSIRPCSLEEAFQQRRLLDYTPTWQNAWEGLRSVERSTICVFAYEGDSLAGYAIYQPVLRRIAHMGVTPNSSHQQIVGAMINYFGKQSQRHDKLEMVNVHPASRLPVVLESFGLRHFVSLYVMERNLGV
ncbi:MAG: acetyltransferase, GNAT family [uncultured bacterium]|nr:MAG: acetyltransferase, GNAT family [uncultured bacterium]